MDERNDVNILWQVGIIFGFSYCGYILAYGLSIPLPASVIGLLLLLVGLRLRIVSEKWIDDAAHFLSANMAFFFLPSTIDLLENHMRIHPVLGELFIVCIASTAVTFFATYHTVRVLRKFASKRNMTNG